MPRAARDTLAQTVAPVGLVLLATALAARAGADGAVFYLFLVGIPVSAAAGLAALGRAVDSGGSRVEAALAGVLVALFVAGAVSRSPVALEAGAPGLASVALVLAFVVLAAQALAAVVRAAR